MHLNDLKIHLYADGADLNAMLEMYAKPYIKGFTTNPTLMRKAGLTDYEAFARQVIERIPDRPISFEVFSDEFDEMERQAHKIKAWGENVYIKIPVTNTQSESAAPLIRRLTDSGAKLNVTAIFTLEQVQAVADALTGGAPSVVSVFAGRIADAGVDPMPLMAEAKQILVKTGCTDAQLLWASPREVLNVIQAEQCGCDIITATTDILKKLTGLGKDLTQFSLETVKMFYDDAQAAGFSL
ncbi:MAG: transaldolase [Phototrophicaceae bacterium]|jgi:transaldolase